MEAEQCVLGFFGRFFVQRDMQIKLDRLSGFSRYGNGAVFPSSAPEPVVDRFGVGVAQGYVEESNVNPVQEMSQLIMVSRAFENISALMRDSDIPIVVFSIREEGSLRKTLSGEGTFTVITNPAA